MDAGIVCLYKTPWSFFPPVTAEVRIIDRKTRLQTLNQMSTLSRMQGNSMAVLKL